MDLKNNQITIRELMAHPQARAVLAKHFPQVSHQWSGEIVVEQRP